VSLSQARKSYSHCEEDCNHQIRNLHPNLHPTPTRGNDAPRNSRCNQAWMLKSSILSRLVEKTLRLETLQTTFLVFLDIFYPQISVVLVKMEFFNRHAC
jgi:hypothetical protein